MPSSASSKIKAKARQLPHRPGVYLMKDRLGRIIYVGKAKDLKKRRFTFVGSTICYAFMQAVGMVNDHTVDCFRYDVEAT